MLIIGEYVRGVGEGVVFVVRGVVSCDLLLVSSLEIVSKDIEILLEVMLIILGRCVSVGNVGKDFVDGVSNVFGFLVGREEVVLVERVRFELEISVDSSVIIEDVIGYLVGISVSNIVVVNLDLVVKIGDIEVGELSVFKLFGF